MENTPVVPDIPSRLYPPMPWWQPEGLLADAQSLAPPASIVVSELRKTNYQREEKAFFAACSAGEIGSQGTFNTLFGGSEWKGTLDHFPNWPGIIWTDPKTGQQSITHAYGAVQFEPDTWNLIAKLTGKYDVQPPSQILNGLYLAYKDFKSRSGINMLDTLKAGQLEKISQYLFLTWPGGCSTGFPARYNAALSLFPADETPPIVDDWVEIRVRVSRADLIALGVLK